MNQEKIGKLIASLRKQLNLTQSELGAKVGVGDRAVSKWERGITCPDISIINDLSKVLGITSDELLKGELNKEHKKTKLNKKYLLFIPIFLIIFIVIFILYNNRTSIYTLKSTNDLYEVEGKIIFEKDKATIIINYLSFKDKDFNKTYIKSYEYNLMSNDLFIVRKGYINDKFFTFKPMVIKEFTQKFSLNYRIDTKIDKKQLVENGLVLEMTFLGIDDNKYNESINIKLGNKKTTW